jgi:hypothetical protein
MTVTVMSGEEVFDEEQSGEEEIDEEQSGEEEIVVS